MKLTFFRSVLLIAMIFVASFATASAQDSSHDGDETELAYSEFLQSLRSGDIKSVEIDYNGRSLIAVKNDGGEFKVMTPPVSEYMEKLVEADVETKYATLKNNDFKPDAMSAVIFALYQFAPIVFFLLVFLGFIFFLSRARKKAEDRTERMIAIMEETNRQFRELLAHLKTTNAGIEKGDG